MNLKLHPTEDLLEELLRRDAVAILQVSQRIEGVEFTRRLGEGDEVRAEAIYMCQRMAGRTIAGDPTVQHVAQRKLQTSRSEEIMVTCLLVKQEAIGALLAKKPVRPDVEPMGGTHA